MSKRKHKKSAKNMWLTWLAIFFIVAGIIQDALWVFFGGHALMWSGAGCFAIGLIMFAYMGNQEKR